MPDPVAPEPPKERASPPRTWTEKIAHVIGAWQAGNRAGDEVIRQRTRVKLQIIGAFVAIGLAVVGLFKDEFTGARRERMAKDEKLAQAFDHLAVSIDTFAREAREREQTDAAFRAVLLDRVKREPFRPVVLKPVQSERKAPAPLPPMRMPP